MKIMVSEQFQSFMKKCGINLNTTLEAAGVNKVIWQEQLELTNGDYWQLMNELGHELSDEMIVQFANIQNINSFMPAFFVALAAKNGLEAIERLATYKALVGPVTLAVTTEQDLVNLQISGTSLEIELPRFTVMTEQLLLVSLLRVGTGQPIKPVLVGSQYQYGSPLQTTFGIAPRQMDRNQIQFRLSDLQRPFISANNTMWTFMRPELDRQKLAIESDKSLEDNVQALLLKKIPSGAFAIEDVAANLNLSVRTLQRNLRSLGRTFTDEVQLARKILVVPLMNDKTLSLIEISYLLGYADPESFSRAFKKWFRQSPSAYRENKLK